MQGFRAMLYKDIQILVRPWNLLLIFLPVFLFLSMQVMSEKVVGWSCKAICRWSQRSGSDNDVQNAN